jgi:hypothetical protein
MVSEEERLLRRLAEAGGCLCVAALNENERAVAETLIEMGMIRYDVAVALTERGQAMVASLKVN